MSNAPPPAPGDAPPAAAVLLRRPIRARDTRWAQGLARAATRAGIRPNTISVLSVGCSALGAGALLGVGHGGGGTVGRIALLLGAALCIQARLLCNLLDGLVAVEGGMRTKSGELYNELPDRVSDALVLAAAGYVTFWTGWERDLGWAAAILAVITAYVRALGGQTGAGQQFIGPMAKQQRMATLTAACVGTAVELAMGWTPRLMTWALLLIVLGAAWTAARRTVRIARELEAR